MKLSDKNHITGLFIYSPTATYERNDLVISGDIIYIVVVDTVTGKEPSIFSDSYKIYLGEKMTSIQEYLEFAEKGLGEDKYISSSNLQGILNHFMIGIDSKGVIGNNIKTDAGFNLKIEYSNIDEEVIFTDYSTVISDIYKHPEINNAIFSVSRHLPELSAYIEGGGDYPCILKQYTYNTEFGPETGKFRVQELIDPETGLVFYRGDRIKLSNWEKETILSPFKCSIINSDELKKRIDKTLAIYESRLTELDSLTKDLKNNFKYKSIPLSELTNTLSLNTLSGDKSIGNSDEVTFQVIRDKGSYYQSNSITINLNIKEENNYPIYEIEDGTLSIEYDSNNSNYVFTLTGNWSFSSVSYRQYYE